MLVGHGIEGKRVSRLKAEGKESEMSALLQAWAPPGTSQKAQGFRHPGRKQVVPALSSR